MAKQRNNILMRGTHGMVGKQIVFKERAGDRYVAAPPTVNPSRKPTAKQQAIQERFKESTAYAAEAISDEAIKTLYQEKANRKQSAHNVAVLDAFYPPEVIEINTAGYRGQAGDIIVIQAQDNFRVTQVNVLVHNAAGELIEEGAAVAGKRYSWTYTITQVNASIPGTKITAKAYDLPGNEGSLEITL